MKIHVGLRYVFSFGEKVSGKRCQVSGVSIQVWRFLTPETWIT